MRTYKIRIQGFAGSDEALAMQEPVARLLCPVAEHDGPCEVPWGFTFDINDLALGIYAAPEKSVEVADQVRRVVGPHPVVLTESTPGNFDELAEQYQLEHP